MKLTFANELKRRGLIDPEMDATFNFSQINYSGKGIHAIVDEIETNMFVGVSVLSLYASLRRCSVNNLHLASKLSLDSYLS